MINKLLKKINKKKREYLMSRQQMKDYHAILDNLTKPVEKCRKTKKKEIKFK